MSDVEASLKALLLPGGTKKPHSEQNSIKNIPNLGKNLCINYPMIVSQPHVIKHRKLLRCINWYNI